VRVIDKTYGSNEDGLVWGYRFVPGQPAQSIGTQEAAELLAAGDAAPQTFVWLHFSLSNQASERYLRRSLALPEAFFDSLRSEEIA